MGVLILTRGEHMRLRSGHPWIYRSEIADVRSPWAPGHVVDVFAAGGQYVGRGTYNPRTSLACRLFTRRDEPVDHAFVLARLRAALAYREAAGLAADAYRLCWSEADGLPGLVVDRYARVSVIQCLTLGMSRLIGPVAAALHALFPDGRMYRLDDLTAAHLEGFEPVRGWIGADGALVAEAPDEPGEVVVTEGACRFAVTVGHGHKTGLYLDQRDNRRLVASLGRGRTVLDAFCYTGGFACQALVAGASHAMLLDSSAEALAGARRNLELNALGERARTVEANAFDELRALGQARERFGLVVLDPPPFTRRKDTLEAAARGYKEINLRGLRLLDRGGVLATFSCSHHVTPALFESVCREAAADAGVAVRLLQVLGQSRDHPVLLHVPETRYLTGLLLEAC